MNVYEPAGTKGDEMVHKAVRKHNKDFAYYNGSRAILCDRWALRHKERFCTHALALVTNNRFLLSERFDNAIKLVCNDK